MSNTPTTEKGTLTKKDLNNVGRRWFMCINTFNYETQLAGSIVYALSPALRKIYKDDDDYVRSLNNHYKYFNCMPWLTNLILGVVLAMEDEKGNEAEEAVQNFKVGLMGPLSGIGDSIFFILIPTIIGSIGGYMAMEGNPLGCIIWLIYGIAMFLIRPSLVSVGYKSGMRFMNELGGALSAFTEAASVLGLTIIGALISSVVNVNTPLTFVSGEIMTEIQPILDTILPSMISVLFILAVSKLLSKKISLSWIILIILIFSWVCAGFGILA